MAQLKVEKVVQALPTGLSADQVQQVKNAIVANLPPETYGKAILFLGWATVLLVVGSVGLALLGKMVPDALWGALGAGIGGLAGVFMGKE
jgi:hypothetical protein